MPELLLFLLSLRLRAGCGRAPLSVPEQDLEGRARWKNPLPNPEVRPKTREQARISGTQRAKATDAFLKCANNKPTEGEGSEQQAEQTEGGGGGGSGRSSRGSGARQPINTLRSWGRGC